MSQENVEVVRRVFEAFNRRDLDRALEEIHQDAEVDFSAYRNTDAGVFRGRDEVRAYMTSFNDPWQEVHWELVEVIEVDETRVIPVLHIRMTGGASGIAIDAHTAHFWTMSGGKVKTVKGFQSKAEALEAAGLAE